MSVLIKGINPPKSCYTCGWYNKVQCPVNDGKCYYRTTRHPNCPLTEIPTPHGRLGDLDELEKQFKRAIGTYLPKDPTRHMSVADGGECRGWTQALTAVLEAKTVIKAED